MGFAVFLSLEDMSALNVERKLLKNEMKGKNNDQ